MLSQRIAVTMRTSAWYGDDSLALEIPEEWGVVVHWPETPSPIDEAEIAHSLDCPAGQPAIRELCRGKTRPLIIVDDLNRPTPADRVIPHLLRQFRDAGILDRNITILVATGTHAAPPPDGPAKKVGREAAQHCRVLVHDCRARAVYVGRTSYGTPVEVNPAVMSADFVIGIGGVYPNYTAGFGGGAKIALGVLAYRSILHLHYLHKSAGGRYVIDTSFRSDLHEVAEMIGLRTTISLHVDAQRRPVHIMCGDHRQYFAAAAALSRKMYSAPPPDDADVIVANAYPEDGSLLFARMKGFAPLRQCAPQASRIGIAACAEGVGYHGLFPEVVPGKYQHYRDQARRLRVMPMRQVLARTMEKLDRKFSQQPRRCNSNQHRVTGSASGKPRNPVWVYCTQGINRVPAQLPGMCLSASWDDILSAVRHEQEGRRALRVVVYPCASLQCVENGFAIS